MKNELLWQPSKFVFRHGKLRASKNRSEVGVGSRLIADYVALAYDNNIPVYAKGKLLDLGCGKVPLYEKYRAYVSDITCVDWSFSPHQTSHLDLEWDLTTGLPFDDCSYDTIVLSDVLEHIPNPTHLLGEISRVLRFNGVLIFNVPFLYNIHEHPYDFFRYTVFGLERIVSDAELEVEHLKVLGGAPEVIAVLLAKIVQKVPILGKTFAVAIQSCVAISVRRVRLFKRLSERTGHLFPLGYFVVARKSPPQKY